MRRILLLFVLFVFVLVLFVVAADDPAKVSLDSA